MKKFKFITSALLALSMLLSLMSTAMAAGTGTITVENPQTEQSYYVYRIFDLETYNKDKNTYSYTLNDKWKAFAEQTSISSKYITLEKSGDKTYVEWNADADVSAFAKLAIAWAKEKKIAPDDGIASFTGDTLVFRSLPLGYYLVDSSVGALCALTTTDPDATVKEKNSLTTVLKLVKENSTNDYVPENSAKIGDIVSFKSEITLGEGAENLVLHDVMNTGLSFDKSSLKIFIRQTEVDAKYYTVSAVYTDDNHFYHALGDSCTFEVSFDNAYIATLEKGTVIQVTYDALLEGNDKEWKTFSNETWVSFGDNLTSTHSKTETHTFSFDLVKTDDRGIAIQTAKFYLYDAHQNGNIIPLVLLSEDTETGAYRYRVATKADNVSGNGAPIKAGYAYIYGLDKQVYYLEEIEQPTGFNKLSERVMVDMTNGDIKADTSGDFFRNGSVIGNNVSQAGGLQVINKTGTVLPSTGGIGTTLFYVCGGILVAAAGILLITKKRMGKEQ